MAEFMFVALLDVPDSFEAEFNRLYDTDHIPKMAAVPGVHSAKRYKVVDTALPNYSRYAATYEIDRPELRESAEWKATASPDWLNKVRPALSHRDHIFYRRIFNPPPSSAGGTPEAGYLYVALLDVPNDFETEFNRLYNTDHVPKMLAVRGVQAAARYKVESTSLKNYSRYAAMYEIDHPDLKQSPEWKATASPDWLNKVRPALTHHEYIMYRRIL